MTNQNTTPTPQPEEKPASDQPQVKLATTISTVTRFVALLRKHNRVVTLVGALIVFATFVFKEALRENFKDLADSVERAEDSYDIRNEMKVTSDSLRAVLREETDAIRDLIKNPRAGDDIDTKLYYLRARRELTDPFAERKLRMRTEAKLSPPKGPPVPPTMDAEDDRIANLDILLEIRHDRQKQPLRVAWKLATRLPSASRNAFEASLYKEAEFYEIDYQLSACLDEPLPSVWEKREAKIKECTTIQRRGSGLLNQADKAMESLLNEAERINEINDRRYRYSTWASYFLYGFGWLLGLVGRLVGVETGAGG